MTNAESVRDDAAAARPRWVQFREGGRREGLCPESDISCATPFLILALPFTLVQHIKPAGPPASLPVGAR